MHSGQYWQYSVNEVNDYVIKGQQVATFFLGVMGDTVVTSCHSNHHHCRTDRFFTPRYEAPPHTELKPMIFDEGHHAIAAASRLPRAH